MELMAFVDEEVILDSSHTSMTFIAAQYRPERLC